MLPEPGIPSGSNMCTSSSITGFRKAVTLRSTSILRRALSPGTRKTVLNHSEPSPVLQVPLFRLYLI